MSLVPKINVLFDSIQKRISVEDVTGLYNAVTNPTGYGGPNLSRSGIANATILIRLNNTFFYSKDVKAEISSSIQPVINFGVLDPIFEEDGVYKTFLIVDSFFSFGVLTFVNNEVNALMSKFWAKLAQNHDIYDKKELEQECIWLESNIQAFPSLERRGMESEYLNLLRFVQKRFEVNKSLLK